MLQRVGKAHVLADQRGDLLGVVVGHAQAAADVLRHGDADFHVIVEADAVRRHAKRRRLADIVQQRAPAERRRRVGRQHFQQQQRVHPDVALGMELRRLLDALHLLDFRQDFVQQAGFVQQLEGAARVAFGEHLGELVADAFAADLRDLRRQLLDGAHGVRVDLVAEAGGEAHRAQHAQLVFREALLRRADGADNAGGAGRRGRRRSRAPGW